MNSLCNRRVKFPFKIAVVVEKRPQRDEKFDSHCMCKKMADGNNTCDLTAVGAHRALTTTYASDGQECVRRQHLRGQGQRFLSLRGREQF